MDPDSADELLDAGVDVLTSGNHIWRHGAIVAVLEREPRLIRPLNFPEDNPGRGWTVQTARDGSRVGVINVIGRALMGSYGCPFRAADGAIAAMRADAKVIVVDVHAETTSEKAALGWHLAGRASVVVGTHTHVQTADERILPGGTAYLTDAGMCGPVDSVIGMRKEEVMRRFLTQMPVRFEVARGALVLSGVIADVDSASGRATAVERFREVCGAC